MVRFKVLSSAQMKDSISFILRSSLYLILRTKTQTAVLEHRKTPDTHRQEASRVLVLMAVGQLKTSLSKDMELEKKFRKSRLV